MILAAAILGLVVGLLRKDGRPASVIKKRFHAWPLLFISLALEILLATSFYQEMTGRFDTSGSLRIVLVILQVGLLLIFLFQNRRKPGMLVTLAGSTLNGLVIIANQGRMPVGQAILRFGEAAAARVADAPAYFLAQGSEPLLFLGDVIPFWTFGWIMISAGDIIIAIGIFLLAAYLPRKMTRPSGAIHSAEPPGLS